MNHKLEQVNEHPTGATEWKCPICGYHVIFSRSRIGRVCLNQGDTSVIHSCGMETANVSLSMNVEPAYVLPT